MLFRSNNSHEAFHGVVRTIYDIAVKRLEIPPSQIVLISESATINKEVENIASEYNLPKIRTEWMRVFERDTQVTPHIPFPTLEDKQYDKKFINLNRRWRLHRPVFVGLLKLNNILDKGYVSLAKSDDNKDWNSFYDDISWISRNNPKFLSEIGRAHV